MKRTSGGRVGIADGIAESNLFNRLEHDFQTLVKKITNTVGYILDQICTAFPEYTPHGFGHVISVLENIDRLLDFEIEYLDHNQIFALLVGTIIHDIGMAPKLFPDDSDEVDDVRKLRIRDEHHNRSQRFVMESPLFAELDPNLRVAIARIAGGHRKVSLFTEQYTDRTFPIADLGFLAGVLRLSDELEITYNRIAFLDAFQDREGFLARLSDASRIHWESHLALTDWKLSERREVLTIFGTIKSDLGHRGIEVVREGISNTLREVRSLTFSGRYTLPLSYLFELQFAGLVSEEYRVRIDNDLITDILIGRLYDNKLIPLRELVQNGIDACQLRGSPTKKYNPVVTVGINAGHLIITDNGQGMDLNTIERYLTVIGRSYYESVDFERFLEHAEFEPPAIGQFGIGIFSTFLISDSFAVRTRFKETMPKEKPKWLETRFTKSFCPTYQVSKPDGSFDYGTQVEVELKDECAKKLPGMAENYLRSVFLRPKVTINYEGKNIGFFPAVLRSLSHEDWKLLFKEDCIIFFTETENSVFIGVRLEYGKQIASKQERRGRTRLYTQIFLCIEGVLVSRYHQKVSVDILQLVELVAELVSLLLDREIRQQAMLIVDFPAGMVEPTLSRSEIRSGVEMIAGHINMFHDLSMDAVQDIYTRFKADHKTDSFWDCILESDCIEVMKVLDVDDAVAAWNLIKDHYKTRVRDIIDPSQHEISYESIVRQIFGLPRISMNLGWVPEGNPAVVAKYLVKGLISRGWKLTLPDHGPPYLPPDSSGWHAFYVFLGELDSHKQHTLISWILPSLGQAPVGIHFWLRNQMISRKWTDILEALRELESPSKHFEITRAFIEYREGTEDTQQAVISRVFHQWTDQFSSVRFLILVGEYKKAIEKLESIVYDGTEWQAFEAGARLEKDPDFSLLQSEFPDDYVRIYGSAKAKGKGVYFSIRDIELGDPTFPRDF